MNGKPSIKIMSKTQLVRTIDFTNTQQSKQKSLNKYNSRKRGSTPLISTSISTQRKNTTQISGFRKFSDNNFMAPKNNLFTIASGKRLSQCQTVFGIRNLQKERSHSHAHQKTEGQKMLLKYSDKLHKLMWNEASENLLPLILSSDFIMDQDAFWSTPKIQTSIIRNWKDLHRYYYVIWVIKSQKGFKRLKEFCETYELPLNAVFYHRRQFLYTIDYTMIRKQLGKVYGSTLTDIIAIEYLKISPKHTYQADSFRGRIPLMLDRRFRVCYLRAEESGQGLDKILQICRAFGEPTKFSERLVQLKSVPIFVEDHLKQLQDQKSLCNYNRNRMTTVFEKCETQFIDEEAIEQEVENFKREMIELVILKKGRTFQYEGCSAHYLVGDIIKRNYDLLYNSALDRRKKKEQRSKAIEPTMRQRVSRSSIDTCIYEKFYEYWV